MFTDHALNMNIAEQVKKLVNIPVLVANRINDPRMAETLLAMDKAEALEFSVKGEAKFLNLPLYRLKLKKNVLIATIIRARRVIIPSGADVMQKGDTVIVVTEADRAIRDLKDIFEGEV